MFTIMELKEFLVRRNEIINSSTDEDELCKIISNLDEAFLYEKYSYKNGDIISSNGITIEISNITKTNRLSGEPYYIYSGVLLTDGLKPKNKKLFKYRSFNSFNL
jgi:hypothetical protein